MSTQNKLGAMMLESSKISFKLIAGLYCFAMMIISNSVFANGDLLNMDVLPTVNGAVTVHLEFSEPADEPSSFVIENPARIAFDFGNVKNKIDERKKTVEVGELENITTIEGAGRTRVVFNLKTLVPYSTKVDGSDVFITLSENANHTVQAAENLQSNDTSHQNILFSGNVASNERTVSEVDFRRGDDGSGRVILMLTDPQTPIDVQEEGTSIYIKVIGTTVSDVMQRRLDVTDFGTPVQSIDVMRDQDDVKVTISATGIYEQLVYQTDNVLTIEIRPLTKHEQAKLEKEKFDYSGERLSLNFQDIEVRAVLQLIADFTQLNIVASDTVQGNVTLRLQNVPWDQALDIILKSKGLDKRQVGNVVMIAPSEEIAAREKLELQANQQVEDLAPLRSEFMQVNYAKAIEVAALLKDQQDTLLSPRGSVSVDERTNMLLVQDTALKLREIRDIVNQLDIPVRQVEIQARIVEAKETFTRDLGIKWGESANFGAGDVRTAITGKSIPARDIATGNVATQILDQALNVNLPVKNPTGSLAFSLARFGSDSFLDLELSAAESEQLIRLVANPRLMTANQKEASIKQGSQIPFLEASSSGAATIAFKDAVLELRVTPQITPDDRVILDLTVKQDSPREDTFGTAVLSIDTKEVNTQVLVDNGETVVLGGVFTRDNTETITRVPFFGELPVLGYLFKNTSVSDVRVELLIFVTPRIVIPTLASR